MFVSIMIVLIVLSDFLSLIYARQRLEYNDVFMLAKLADVKLDEKFNGFIARNGVRTFLAICIFIFWIYSLIFLPYLRISIILNMIITFITTTILIFITKRNGDMFATLPKRVLIVRLDAIISLCIWAPHFLPLLALAF